MLKIASEQSISRISVGAPHYFPALTGVRAIAALLVFFTHFNPFEEVKPVWPWAQAFVHQGHFGVPVFFVLSGFLIATRYRGRVQTTWPWFRNYMQNRVARIYPLYFLLTALTFMVYQMSPDFDFLGLWRAYTLVDKLAVMILNFSLLRGLFSNFFFSGISQGWSLTVEETFYLLAPLLLLTAGRRGQRLWLWVAGLLATGLLLVAVFSPLSATLRGFFKSVPFMLQWTFFGHAAEFTAGIGLALLIAREGPKTRPQAWATYTGIAWIIGCAAFMATLLQLRTGINPEYLKIFTINLLLPPGICLLFYGLLREQSAVRTLLETKTFDLLGKSSYAFYLIHLGVLSVLLHKLNCSILTSLVLTTLLSIALFKLVEEPVHKKLRAKI